MALYLSTMHGDVSSSLFLFLNGHPRPEVHLEIGYLRRPIFCSAMSLHVKQGERNSWTYVMSPAVDGNPYSSNRRIKSPNCP